MTPASIASGPFNSLQPLHGQGLSSTLTRLLESIDTSSSTEHAISDAAPKSKQYLVQPQRWIQTRTSMRCHKRLPMVWQHALRMCRGARNVCRPHCPCLAGLSAFIELSAGKQQGAGVIASLAVCGGEGGEAIWVWSDFWRCCEHLLPATKSRCQSQHHSFQVRRPSTEKCTGNASIACNHHALRCHADGAMN